MRRGGGGDPGGSRYRVLRQDPQAEEPSALVSDRAIVCDVRMQTLLYFSFWYDILFALVHALTSWVKWRWIRGNWAWSFFAGNLVVAFVVEPIRLYLGYSGNLGEGVPQLFLFVFVCTTCLAYLAAELTLFRWLGNDELRPGVCSVTPPPAADGTPARAPPCLLPLEHAAWIVRLALLLLEVFVALRALARLIQEQSARFFVSLEAAAASGASASTDGIELMGIGPSSAQQQQQRRGGGGGGGGGGGAGAAWAEGPSALDISGARGGGGSAGGGASASMIGRPAYRALREHAD